MERVVSSLIAVAALLAVVGCATTTEWCSNPENAKIYGGYENCIKAREPKPVSTY